MGEMPDNIPFIHTDPKFTPALNEAFAKAQGSFIHPEKNKEVEVKKYDEKSGTYKLLYKTKYADLNNVIESFRPHLSANGLSFTQKTVPSDKGWRLVLTLKHSSGEYDETSMPINLDAAPQMVGSQLTYLKRYQAAGYFGIAADDDDDGNGTTGNEADIKDRAKATPAKPAQTQKPTTTTNRPATGPKAETAPKWTPATPEQLEALTEIAMAREVKDEELNYLLKTGFGWTQKEVPSHFVDYVLKILKDPSTNSGTVMAAGAILEEERKPKDKADPKDFVLLFGDAKTAGKKLGDLTEQTLKNFLGWADKELQKSPPVANMSAIFTAKTQVKEFFKSVGVQV